MNKSYQYKWFRGQEYLGLLEKPINEFRLNQEINTAGSQIEIELPISLQDSNLTTDTDRLVDENGDAVVDGNLNDIITRLEYLTGKIPQLNDRIKVYEFSDDYPGGKKMFEGLVSKLKGGYLSSSVTLSVIGYGVQLDNYIIQVLPEHTLTENDTANIDSTEVLYAENKTPLNRITGAAQTFQIPASSDVLKVRIVIGNTGSFTVPCTLSIVQGTPTSPGSTLGSVTRNIPVQADIATEFQFATTVSLDNATTYHFKIFNNDFSSSGTNTLGLGYETTGTYADGQMFTFNDSTGWASTTRDIGFEVISSSGGVGNQFNSRDPSTILRDLLDNFIALGGELNYTTPSIADTNTTVSYTFKFNTYLDGLKKCVELAPADWYYYVDPANSTVYFNKKQLDADHIFIRGKHIHDLELEYSLEQLKNKVWFSGGDVAGSNLLIFSSNTSSIEKWGHWLDKPSDNRVTLEDTAQIISNNIINQRGNPEFSVSIKIPSTVYDTTTIKIGETIGFNNFNDLIDNLRLQVHALQYTPDLTTISLELLLPTQSKRIEDIKRNLDRQETENNPSDT